jgi:hypothetical protein
MAGTRCLIINAQQARSAPSPTELGFTRVRRIERAEVG